MPRHPVPPRDDSDDHPASRFVRVRGAREHNLKDIDVDIPRDALVVFTGISGSGKSSLAFGTLYAEAQRRYFESVAPYARRLIEQVGSPDVDAIEGLPPAVALQQQRGTPSARSSVGTVTTLASLLRMLYSRAGNYPPLQPTLYAEDFSPNTPQGACPDCHGLGRVYQVTERSMVSDDSLTIRERAVAAWPPAWHGQNLRDILVTLGYDVDTPCPTCHGARYNEQTLKVTWRDRNIAEVLRMTVEEAVTFFAGESAVSKLLALLKDIGLGYLRLGQPATELSGGEAQRIKLATELQRPQRGETLYVLDEPTTGLHPADVDKLLAQLQGLVDAGNTVVVVEHELHVVAQSDWVIDVGPGAGQEGGRIVACGTPGEVCRVGESRTGVYLRRVMSASTNRSKRINLRGSAASR